jgi:hypothetical protein
MSMMITWDIGEEEEVEEEGEVELVETWVEEEEEVELVETWVEEEEEVELVETSDDFAVEV